MKTLLFTRRLAAVILFSGLISSCTKETPPPVVSEISINNKEFNPDHISIPVGTKITWTNKAESSHTVTSTTHEFNSGEIKKSETYSIVFSQPGNYGYYCTFDNAIRGTITVK